MNLGAGVPVDVFTEPEALMFLAARTGQADAAGAQEVAASDLQRYSRTGGRHATRSYSWISLLHGPPAVRVGRLIAGRPACDGSR